MKEIVPVLASPQYFDNYVYFGDKLAVRTCL